VDVGDAPRVAAPSPCGSTRLSTAPDRLMTHTTPPPRPASQPPDHAAPATAGLQALDRLVATYGEDALLAKVPTPAAADALGDVVRLLCAEARRANPGHAERLVIALRAAWPTLPAVRRLPPGAGRDGLLARVVTLAIAEFYRSPHGDGGLADQIGDADGRVP
jgi:hypothetical protein